MAALALLACKKSGASSDKAAASATAAKADPLELDAIKLDKDVVAAVKSATSCEMNSSITYKCDAYKNAMEALKKILKSDPRAPAVFETLAALPFNKDQKLKEIAPYFLRSTRSLYIFPKLAKRKDGVSKATANRMLHTLENASDDMASGLARPAVYAATLAAAYEPAFASIKAVRSESAKRNAIEGLMTYGRMNVFKKVQAYAAGNNMKLRQAALDAPRSMSKWSDSEAKTICPWAEPYIKDKDLGVAGSAARNMVRCKHLHDGKYIKTMLAEGKRRVQAGEWKKPFVWAYRDICFGGFFGTDKPAPGGLCDQNYAFLEWVANQKNVEPWYRGFALDMIYYQRRDSTTYALLKKYKNSPVPEIRKTVAEDMKSLQEHYLKKK